jgi:hypothetical protein
VEDGRSSPVFEMPLAYRRYARSLCDNHEVHRLSGAIDIGVPRLAQERNVGTLRASALDRGTRGYNTA